MGNLTFDIHDPDREDAAKHTGVLAPKLRLDSVLYSSFWASNDMIGKSKSIKKRYYGSIV